MAGMNGSENTEGRYCIVGAGPAGLCAARAFKRLGIPYDQYERHSDVGGIWDMDNPGSPMYETAHFISSKGQTYFAGLPMPESFPDYPKHDQVLAYIRSFADAYGLRDAIRFNTVVERVEKAGENWRVTLDTGEQIDYSGVVCVNGEVWDPIMPDYPGEFAGEMRHSVTYRHPDEFRGRRVLVIGAGNSGCDIACDAAQNADAAFISLRRGYHFLPKHIFGIPADEFAARGPQLPMWLEQPLFSALLRVIVGKLSRYGLPEPDHKLFESHPILNTQLLHYLGHGDIAAKPDVQSLEGDRVRFADGSTEAVDLVICATGYYKSIPYMDPQYFRWTGHSPDLYLNIFNRDHDGLYGMSFIETNSGAYQVFDLMAHILANHIADKRRDPERAARFRRMVETDETDLSGGIDFVDSERHRIYVDGATYQRHLKRLIRRMGWPKLTPEYFEETAQRRSAAAA